MRTVFGDVVIPKVAPPTTGRKDPAVEALQRELKSQGFDPGPPDGVMGPRTQAAVNARNTANAQRMTDAAAVANATTQSRAETDQRAYNAANITPMTPEAKAAQSAAILAQAKVVMDPGSVEAKQELQAATTKLKSSLKQEVDGAQAKVATAPTPQAKEVAVRQLQIAESNLAAVDPGMPVWQKVAIGVGAGSILLGLFLALRRK